MLCNKPIEKTKLWILYLHIYINKISVCVCVCVCQNVLLIFSFSQYTNISKRLIQKDF